MSTIAFGLGWIDIFHIYNLILWPALSWFTFLLAIKVLWHITAVSHLSIISIIQNLFIARKIILLKSMRTLFAHKTASISHLIEKYYISIHNMLLYTCWSAFKKHLLKYFFLQNQYKSAREIYSYNKYNQCSQTFTTKSFSMMGCINQTTLPTKTGIKNALNAMVISVWRRRRFQTC
jgi:hypothetical protein